MSCQPYLCERFGCQYVFLRATYGLLPITVRPSTWQNAIWLPTLESVTCLYLAVYLRKALALGKLFSLRDRRLLIGPLPDSQIAHLEEAPSVGRVSRSSRRPKRAFPPIRYRCWTSVTTMLRPDLTLHATPRHLKNAPRTRYCVCFRELVGHPTGQGSRNETATKSKSFHSFRGCGYSIQSDISVTTLESG